MVAIGSSTTAGYITTSPDSSWFGRFTTYYRCRAGIIDSAYNLGVPGAGVYAGMPSSLVPPAGRPNPDVSKNVTIAVSVLRSLANAADGVIIINYPSNEYNVYSIPEIMNCLQIIYDSATRLGNRCYVTTTQPRSDQVFNTPAMKRKLADIKDSTINRFGVARTLNFWDGMFNPADTTILPVYSAGDQIHFNDLGHKVLFDRLVAKNIFNMPVWYAASAGYLNQLASWGSNTNGTGSHPPSFTGNNQVFVVANNPAPAINSNLTITGRNVQLIIGDGTRPVILRVPAAYKLTIISPQPVSLCD